MMSTHRNVRSHEPVIPVMRQKCVEVFGPTRQGMRRREHHWWSLIRAVQQWTMRELLPRPVAVV